MTQQSRVLYKIPTGATGLGGEIDLSAFQLVAIQGGTAWTAAALSFKGRATKDSAADQSTTPPFSVAAPAAGEVVDDAAAAIAVSMAANVYTVLTGAEKEALSAVRYLTIRSGTSGVPVNQAADRYIWLVIQPLDT